MAADIPLAIALALYALGAGALYLYGLNCYVMIRLFARARPRQQAEDAALRRRFAESTDDDDVPVVTTQLPIYNERFVVERLLRAVVAFDYPQGKHEIQVLDDSTDESLETNRALVAVLRAEGHDIHHIHRADRTGYKAGALAAGMAQARGEHLAVFDADFVPEPDFLRNTVPFLVMDPRCGFVQTRWGHRNRDYSLLTQVQALGIDGHFVVEQSARAWNGLFLNFNGTAGIWRRATIEDAGGWQADTITEDLDLSYRAQLGDWHGRFLFDTITPAELPTDINAFKSQQHRWAKGSIQTAMKLLPTILRRADVGWFKKLQAVLHLTHYLVHPIMLLMTLLVLPILLWGHRILSPTWLLPVFVVMLVSMVAPSTLYLYSQRMAYTDWKKRVKLLPALAVLGVGLAVNNTKGVLEALLGHRQGEFVRTPKLGSRAERSKVVTERIVPVGGAAALVSAALVSAPAGGYRIPINGLYVIELLMGLWAVLAFVQYLTLYKLLIGPLLLLHALGFLVVGTLSVLHHRRALLDEP